MVNLQKPFIHYGDLHMGEIYESETFNDDERILFLFDAGLMRREVL